MMIEIHGGGFGNKGAQLMLLAVLQKFAPFQNVHFCMSPTVRDPREERAKYNLKRHFPLPVSRGGRLFPIRFLANRAVSALVPQPVSQALGYVRYRDTHALLDISGIRYGDVVDRTSGENLNLLASYYRARGKPVILLPQMLGPFTTPTAAALYRGISEQASLIFARDRKSYEYAQAVTGPTPSLRRAPDITVFCDADYSRAPQGVYGCIVPNARMLDRGKASWSTVYLDRLVTCARVMLQNGIRPIILVHSVEGGEDTPLANELRSRLGEDHCSLLVADEPLQAKGILARAKLVVASRYHSVVSSLSSGTPAIVLGWAHKYDTLLEDFGVADLNHTPEQGDVHLETLVTRVANDEENSRLRQLLVAARETMRDSHDNMWREVFRTLGLQSAAPESAQREPKREAALASRP